MSDIALGLGANLGDRLSTLRKAVSMLQSLPFEVRAKSDVFETPPWGVTNQPLFLNACVTGDTNLSPEALLAGLKKIERALGRVPNERWGPRAIDIDILLWKDGRIVYGDGLIIPHPEMDKRAFVLTPLAQIAPEAMHPIRGMTIAELAAGVDASGIVKIVAL